MPALIDRLAQLIIQDNAVLFVGGSLRHGQGQLPVVTQIAEALAGRIQYRRPDRSLPAVARDFEVLRGRNGLILALREELEKVGGGPSPLYQLLADAVLPNTKVITTRFDGVLEQALDEFQKAYVRIVRDTDVPFFDETKVILIKMQGDIGQPDSLVITEDDVDAFLSKLPTVSDVVRAFFATKTLIFLGYDLADDQFKRFYRQVTRNLSIFRRQAYAVVPESLDEIEAHYWRDQNVEIFPQEPLAFLEELAQAIKAASRKPRAVTDTFTQPAPPALPPYPYKALDSFGSADEAIFAGRAAESQRLANRILAHRLTVLYGESGSGKTSLLQAGTGPRLARQRALLVSLAPAPHQPLLELFGRGLMSAGLQAGLPPLPSVGQALPAPAELPAEAAPGDTGSLATSIRVWQRALDGPIVLIIDPFEQFFLVYSQEERRQALAALAGWLNDRSLDWRLVLVLREDYLGRLQPLEETLPGLLDVRFRLERLGREAARAAIEEPARLFAVTWEPALVQTLLDDLYDSGEGGVAPPQLQIVCDSLYRAVVGPGREGGTRISLADFERLGGTAAILGDYLDRTVAALPAGQQPAARALLGALVSSSGLKQRLPLDGLARAAELEPAEAAGVLDELTRQRLVRCYQLAGGAPPEYELTHDTLAARIARWLGDDFWAAQKAREIVRLALPEWRSRARLLAPDDLRLVNAQHGRVSFAAPEVELIYAAAVAYDQRPADWQALLPEADCREILLHLLRHPEPAARRQAARELAGFAGEASSASLAQAALADPDPAVRLAAAEAIARPGAGEPLNRAAVTALVQAAADPAVGGAARQALATVRDLQPASQALLPPGLAGTIRRQVWANRWQRHRPELLAATLQGIQGGFWGLGLGMGLFLALHNVTAAGQDQLFWSTRLQLMSLGIPLAGVLGALAAGGGTLVKTGLFYLQDREQPWRSWVTVTLASALLLGLGFVGLSYLFPGQAQPVRAMAAGILIGLGLAGAAALPVRLGWPLRLGLAVLAGVAVFGLAVWLGLFFTRSTPWLVVMGGASGAGFFWALNPGFWRGKR